MDELASVDGVIGPAGAMTVPVTDEGLLRGDGVFEVARLYGGRPFAWDEHVERLERSAANLRLEFDLDAAQAEVAALLERAGAVDGTVRLLITRAGRRVVVLAPPPVVAPTITLGTVEYAPSRVLDAVKSLSYAANMHASRLAREAGAGEALLVTPDGLVLEGPTSAFFYVRGGRLHTPPLADHVLDSITRRHVLAVSGATERSLRRDELDALDEAFLASTTREVQPVAAIDARDLPAAPGPLTAAAADAFRRYVADRLAP
ncbi:aminotransferase class IV [Pseudonocardia broussonetiae]|uniref:4-amino-4-deoxychorismate lyase n=1 Tax=Pseudonocardia broussonetiae TaxID=2736640 RepID=A0A6M6JRQ6_9PSEU|nr:aminotransferase class IV [Pseudonocardia broussonetiae]QJY49836.1 4-amino-4-deoxychorismate lyase [Pseudonocardia broussonetiae]